MQASLDITRRIRASIVVLASFHGAAMAQAPAPVAPPAPPATAKPAEPPAADEPKSGVWGVPGPNAAQGGVSTPLAGPGSPGAATNAAAQ
ncbi:MAG: hypothetical protein ACKOV8_06645, partial [Phycisphaerales bacterium]